MTTSAATKPARAVREESAEYEYVLNSSGKVMGGAVVRTPSEVELIKKNLSDTGLSLRLKAQKEEAPKEAAVEPASHNKSHNNLHNKKSNSKAIVVDASRFSGDKKVGDIAASHSAAVIADRISKVRKPFLHEGVAYVNTGGGGSGSIEAYRLLPEAEFKGKPTSYAEKTGGDGAEKARNDPNGFYHGMLVQSRKQPHVLVGPPTTFTTDGESRSEVVEAPAVEETEAALDTESMLDDETDWSELLPQADGEELSEQEDEESDKVIALWQLATIEQPARYEGKKVFVALHPKTTQVLLVVDEWGAEFPLPLKGRKWSIDAAPVDPPRMHFDLDQLVPDNCRALLISIIEPVGWMERRGVLCLDEVGGIQQAFDVEGEPWEKIPNNLDWITLYEFSRD